MFLAQVNSRFIPSDPADTVQPGTYMGIISVMISNNVQMKFEVKGYNFMQGNSQGSYAIHKHRSPFLYLL